MEVVKIVSLVVLLLLGSILHAQKGNKDAMGKLNVNTFFNDKNVREWFLPEYNQYALQEVLVEEMKPIVANKQFVIVMGTWCEDSHFEFPRVIKLMDALNLPKKRLQIYGVDKTKTEPAEVIKEFNISKVPTVLVKGVDETEWQIVAIEKPQISWEVDLLNLLKKKP